MGADISNTISEIKDIVPGSSKQYEAIYDNSSDENDKYFKNIHDIHGIWTLITPTGRTPCSRDGHFSVYSESDHSIYIGYGLNKDKQYLSDIWKYDILNYKWTEIELSGARTISRTGASACVYNNKIYIYGGFHKPHFFSDLHSIDITTGFCEFIDTKGPEPIPRSFPVLAIYNSSLYIWGGYNRDHPKNLDILDLFNLTWRSTPTNYGSHTTTAHHQVDHKVIGFGGNEENFIILNLEKEHISKRKSSGSISRWSAFSPGLVAVDDYLFDFGGSIDAKEADPFEKQWSLIYVCNIHTRKWIIFPIVPDFKTVNLKAGCLTEEDLFYLPRTDSFTCVYEPKIRSIIATLGNPKQSTNQVTYIEISSALSMLHIKDDMEKMLNF